MCSPHNLILPVATQSTHPIYALFRDPEGGMVGMGCQDKMVEMDSKEAKEKRETLVCRDHRVSLMSSLATNQLNFK